MKQTALMRILMLMLALCMMVSVFAACATEDDGEGDAATEASSSSADNTEEEEEELTLGVDITLDREVKILYSKHMASDICPEEGDVGESVVKKSIYDRWQNVQDKLNVEISWIAEDGQWNGTQTTFAQKVETMSNTGNAYDAVVCYNLIPGLMASKGLLLNLMESDYIDLTKP